MNRKIWAALGACLLVYLGFCLPLIPIAADDIRMVDVFSMDEAGAVAVVRYLFLTGTWTLETFSYGGLFYYLPLVLLKGLNALGVEIGDWTITVLLRGVCTLAGVGCLWLTFRIGWQIAGAAAGVVAAWLLMMTPTFLRWSVEIHPDIPQLFWLLCALLACVSLCDQMSLRRAALAGLFAGLAFGTKYSGAFLVPVIGLAIWQGCAPAGDWKRWILGTRRSWVAVGLALVGFFAAFGLTNFSALVHWDAFRSDVGFERAHLAFGHEFRASSAGLRWMIDLAYLSGPIPAGIFVAFAGWSIYTRRLARQHVLLLVWISILMGYLLAFANLRAPRHLLPILPGVLVGVGAGCLWMHAHRRLWSTVMLGIAALIVAAARADDIYALWAAKYDRASERDEIAAGQWLAATFAPDTSVLYHAYAYVPTRFGDVFRTSSMNYAMVNHFEPDVLVVRDGIARRYANVQDADLAQKGREAFLDQHYFYSFLRNGLLNDYALMRDFGAVAIYRRTKPKDATRPDLSWFQRVEMFGQGKILGARDAFERMAQIHEIRGNREEAARAKTRAKSASGGLNAQLAEGVRALRKGDVIGARTAFDAIRSATAGLSDAQRASVSLVIGRAYLETGRYDEAIAACREALGLNPDFREALFDLGFFYFLSGDDRRAENAYTKAVDRYGADARAADLLRQMISEGMRVAAARRLLSTHFGER